MFLHGVRFILCADLDLLVGHMLSRPSADVELLALLAGRPVDLSICQKFFIDDVDLYLAPIATSGGSKLCHKLDAAPLAVPFHADWTTAAMARERQGGWGRLVGTARGMGPTKMDEREINFQRMGKH